MAIIKIRGRKDPIVVENERARKIKVLRFGRPDGTGKADPKADLDLGDEWAGTVGEVAWIELDKLIKPAQTKAVQINATRAVKIVPISYELQEGESLI